MRNSLCFVLLLTMVFPLTINAQDERQYINYFYVKGEVCLPVRIKHSGGEFYVYKNGERHDGALSYVEAWDCQNRHIISPTLANDGYSTDKSKPIIRNYTFEYLYPESNAEKVTSGEPEMTTTQRAVVGVGSAIGSGVKSIWGGTGFAAEGYPNFQVGVGASRAYGEFARAKVCLGDEMGFAMYGGIGKEYLLDSDCKDRTAWHVGIGCYFMFESLDDEDSDLTIGLTYAGTPLQSGRILMLDGTYSIFFTRSKRIGLFGGCGLGIGKVNELLKDWGYSWSEVGPNFIWDLNVGISIKLWSE